MKKEVQEYLYGNKCTGLLLIGTKGNKEMREDAAYVASSLLGVKPESLTENPDFMSISLDPDSKSLGVDKAEQIIARSQLRPAVGDRIVIIIDDMDKLTVQAQNKLLKTLEESETTLVIGIAYEDSLISTVKSRMQCIYYKDKSIGQLKSGDELDFFASEEGTREYFEGVQSAIALNNFGELLNVLHLVKEKDGSEFFSSCRNSVSKMISFIGYLLNARLKDIYDPDTAYAVGLCGSHWMRCNAVSYTKADFFSLISEIVTVLNKEVKN